MADIGASTQISAMLNTHISSRAADESKIRFAQPSLA
jgi:hypothetical protein